MKKLFFSIFIFITTGIFAQDLIILKDRNIIEAKVTEISQTEIRYKRFNHIDGSTIVVPAENVLSIRYENGMIDIINAASVPLTETTAPRTVLTQPETDTAAELPETIQSLAETTVIQPADIKPLADTEPILIPAPIPVPAAIPAAIPAARQPESMQDRNPKLNSLGISLGYMGLSNFGFSAIGTVSPGPYTFFDFNLGLGFWDFSFFANVFFNGFVPFKKGGWYGGFGIGGGVYGPADSINGYFDINLITGFIFFDWLNISFTLQMELVPEFNINPKPMIGYIYRFIPHVEPVHPVAEPVRIARRPVPVALPDNFKIPDNHILIYGGTFYIGQFPDRVRKTVSSFYMGKYEVTQREYREIMGANPSQFTGDDLPVERVSWFDAIEYCNRRSLKEGLTPAYFINNANSNITVIWNRNANGYRLPTEAEWEFACRAGFTTRDTTNTNIANIAGENGIRMTANAGSYAPNAFGLYDMFGNVWEWCWDWFGYYKNTIETDPIGAASGPDRIFRGGGWGDSYAKSGYRGQQNPLYRSNQIGFRVVLPYVK